MLGRICRCDSTYTQQNVYLIAVNKTIDEYKIELFKKRICLIRVLLGMESVGTLENCGCDYIDIDYSDIKELKKNLLWKRNK